MSECIINLFTSTIKHFGPTPVVFKNTLYKIKFEDLTDHKGNNKATRTIKPNKTKGGKLTAVFLILPVGTVALAVAAEDTGDAATGLGALELARQTHVDVCTRDKRE